MKKTAALMGSLIFVAGLGVVLNGCATREGGNAGLELMSETEFQNTVEKFTRRSQQYQGLYNTVDIHATLRNSSVIRAQLEQNARLYQWDRAKFQLESNKAGEKAKNETEVFLSFYTPDRKNDDLQKSSTQWRTYLEVDGRRWEGKVTKVKTTEVEIQGMYPYYTRLATPYSVTFPVPIATVEGKEAKVTLTGPVALVVLAFPPLAGPGTAIAPAAP